MLETKGITFIFVLRLDNVSYNKGKRLKCVRLFDFLLIYVCLEIVTTEVHHLKISNKNKKRHVKREKVLKMLRT